MTGLRFGYGTNGFANHRLADALGVLADLGYDGVALTLDPAHLDPLAPDLLRRTDAVGRRLAELGLAVVIETGGRYVLDPVRKHWPTLLSDAEGQSRRVDMLQAAVRVAAELGAEAVSLWSGAASMDASPEISWQRLAAGCDAVVGVADAAGVVLGFEPEPGMLVDDIDGWYRLADALGRPACFGLTLDIGHCRCIESAAPDECVRRVGAVLVNVQIDDMCRGVHEHLPLGEGEIDFPPVLAALRDVGYRGLVSVELPRHSHAAPQLAAESIAFLRGAMPAKADVVRTA